MFNEVKAGDRVWEDYNRDRSGVCQEVFTGKKGAVYAKILWDGQLDVCGNALPAVLADKVSVKNIRATRKPEFMSAEEKTAMEAAAPIQAISQDKACQETVALTKEETHIIVAALKSFAARPQIRHKIGQLLERLET